MLSFDNAEIRQDGFRLSAHFDIAHGARVAIMGPSGAGKSTLLSTIAGFVPLRAGRILWQGQDLTSLTPGARPLSILFQDGNLFPHLSVAQNIGLGLRPDLRLNDNDRARVQDALDQVGLTGMGKRLPGALSGGQQSRVALARVLLRARPLLLLDEPFSALGPALKSEMLGLVARLQAQANTTILMVTHDPADARALADQIVLVADGQASPPAPTAALLSDPPAALRAYLGDGLKPEIK